MSIVDLLDEGPPHDTFSAERALKWVVSGP